MSRKEEPVEHAVTLDQDELYDRISRSCIVEPTVMDNDSQSSDSQFGLRKRHYPVCEQQTNVI